MAFLAPLYIAGLIAVSLPILFHLIRRTPQGRQAFSSLMFLQPSPPRLTKRSRLSNILLLILRGLALILLALAFARPLFQNRAEADSGAGRSKRIAILVDTSASMRRADLWAQANAKVDQTLKDVTPADEVGLFFFDRGVRPAVTFAEWNELESSKRVAVLKGRLEEASPTWYATSLGEALSTTADLLAEAEGSRGGSISGGRQLVLISDLQQGGHAELLQGHQWPEHVTLQVHSVAPTKQPTNAAVQAVRETTVDPADDGSRLRVRVASQPGATAEQFSLRWADAKGPLAGMEPVQAYVPAGRSQVVRVPWPPADRSADRLVLAGDDADFDNTLYVVRPIKEDVRVVYAGDDKADDARGLQFYFRSAAADTHQRTVDLVAKRADEPLAEPDLLGARLLVVSGSSLATRAALARRFAETGGDALVVLNELNAETAAAVEKLLGNGVKVEEATGRDFSLIARVDVQHSLFTPFADARLGDFTKIHFWKHRRVTLPAKATARAIATFDGGDPFLIEQPVGRGRVFVMTAGWQPADSQLALSTKFVPLVEGLLRRKDGAVVGGQFAVGDVIPLPALPQPTTAPATAPSVARSMLGPAGKPIPLAADAATFAGADRPGVYKLTLNGEEQPIAVNLAADESRTAPLAVEDLERWGAKMGVATPPEDLVTRQRQFQRAELENRQKLWQWLIVIVLVLLAAETFVAGRLARRASRQVVAA